MKFKQDSHHFKLNHQKSSTNKIRQISKHVSHLFKMAAADIEVCERVPEKADLICVSLDALSDDSLHLQRRHFVRILGYQLTQLVP